MKAAAVLCVLLGVVACCLGAASPGDPGFVEAYHNKYRWEIVSLQISLVSLVYALFYGESTLSHDMLLYSSSSWCILMGSVVVQRIY